MADFKKLTVDGTTYNVKDDMARSQAASAYAAAGVAQATADQKMPISGTVTGNVNSYASNMYLGAQNYQSFVQLQAGSNVEPSWVKLRDSGKAQIRGGTDVEIIAANGDVEIRPDEKFIVTANQDVSISGGNLLIDSNDGAVHCTNNGIFYVEGYNDLYLDSGAAGDVYIDGVKAANINDVSPTLKDHVYYAVCSTAGSTADKVATCAGYTLTVGSCVMVYFENSNSASVTDLTLDVNNTGAKPIYIYRNAGSTSIPPAPAYLPQGVIPAWYNGNQWVLLTNTDYFVQQSDTTMNGDLRLLLSYGANDTSQVFSVRKSGKITFNPSTNTFKINSVEMAQIPAPPTTDGTYTLSVTVSSGVPTYTWS